MVSAAESQAQVCPHQCLRYTFRGARGTLLLEEAAVRGDRQGQMNGKNVQSLA